MVDVRRHARFPSELHTTPCDQKIPVLKPGRTGNLTSDLRPITLVNCITKVYERFLLLLLEECFTSSEIQAGFKKNYSCIQRVFCLQSVIEYTHSVHRSNVYCVFIDFSSFFDTIQPELLISYLYDKDIPPSLCRALHAMFKHLKAKVRLNNSTGDQFDVKVGIRQGSVISPFLGNAFLEQLTDLLKPDLDKIEFYGIELDHIFLCR